MPVQRSRLAAAEFVRPRVIAPPALAAFVALVCVAMVLMFPYRVLVERTLSAKRGDALTVAYLHNLLRTDAGNAELRIALAQQLGSRGDTAEARAILAPLLNAADPQIRGEAHWLDWTLLEQEAFAHPADSPARQAAMARLRDRLLALSRETGLRETDRIALARKALSYGEPALAHDLFEQIARSNSDLGAGWYAEAARAVLAQGEYEGASQLLAIARARSYGLDAQRRYFIESIRALQAGNLLDQALATAERELGTLADDTETLYFMVELARAANRPDIADRYARRMLRMSLLDWLRRRQLAAAGFDGGIVAVSTAAASQPPRLGFDDRVFSLAYEAFLGNRNLADAWQVADAAVRAAPRNTVWRERLAQVSEWLGKPEEALGHWLELARQTDREDAWQAVLRLAPGLFDDPALLLALEHELRRRPGDARLLTEIVAVYERIGEPAEAMRILQAHTAGRADAARLRLLAGLAERSGDIDAALDALGRLDALEGPGAARAAHRASLLVTLGRFDAALAVLDAARAVAGDGDADYWRFYASLALLLQRQDLAREALARVIALPDAQAAEFSDLVELLRTLRPLDAARLAEQAWRRFDTPAWLQRTLDLYLAAGELRAIDRLFGALSVAQSAQVARSAALLQLRARWHLDRGRRGAALRDLERAIALAPDAIAPREALLWALIDGNETLALQTLLARHEARWAHEPDLHDALGAAWQALSRPQVALERYWQPRAAAHRGDFLWLMNFADALEQNGEVDRAWRLRESLMRQRTLPAGSGSAAALDETRRIARLRLMRSQRPGDASLALLRELLRLDRGADSPSPQVREVVLSWFIAQGDPAAARGYLWEHYARSLTRPLWAEINVALAAHDAPAIGALLERWDARLPRYDRVNAARAVNAPHLAASAAFEAFDQQRDDDALHLQMSEVLLAQGSHASGRLARRDLGTLAETETALQADTALTPRLRLDVRLARIARTVRDRTVFDRLPGHDTLLTLRLDGRHDNGLTQLSVGRREAVDSVTPWALSREQSLTDDLGITARLGFDQPAQENSALRIAGVKDGIGLGLQWRATRDTRLGLSLDRFRYRTQGGVDLGRAQQWQVTLTHALRSELPDLEGSIYLSGYNFTPDGNATAPALVALAPLFAGGNADPALLRPDDYRLWGARLSSNMRLSADDSRGLRPYGALGVNDNSTTGAGYEVEIGLAGSVLGGDHLALGLRQDKGGAGEANRNREFYLDYRLTF